MIIYLIILGNQWKRDLKLELNIYNLTDLFAIFKQEKIRVNIMWKLNHGELLEMGLKVGQRHRYMEAKRLRLEEMKNGSKFII